MLTPRVRAPDRLATQLRSLLRGIAATLLPLQAASTTIDQRLLANDFKHCHHRMSTALGKSSLAPRKSIASLHCNVPNHTVESRQLLVHTSSQHPGKHLAPDYMHFNHTAAQLGHACSNKDN
jgi:hypothetical protein